MSPEKLGAEMYLANGDTSRRGTINLCQKHRSGQCGGATTRAVPRFVAGNCLSARETSRWNFRSPPFLRCRDFAWKFSEESRELTIFVCAIEENFDGWGIEDFFLRIARENYFSRGKRVEGGLKEFRYCDYSKIFMVNDFRNARGIITSWKWNFGFNQNEIVNVGLEYYKRRTYYA